MTTSTNHRVLSTAAATGLVGALLALSLNSAYAAPERDDRPHGHYVGHACFITPHTWSGALDGALPRCYTYVP